MNESIAGFLDSLTGELQRLLSADQTEQVTVSWNRDQQDAVGPDLAWCSFALNVDPALRIYAGTDRKTNVDASFDDPQETLFAVLTRSIQHAAKARLGGAVSCKELGTSEEPPSGWTGVPVGIVQGARSRPMYLVLSPDLAVALGGAAEESAPAPGGGANPLDILQHVEVPVSVSFGRTHLMLKDLLALAHGSVVQLDRELGDEVELRVNNCVIARGEVVAVEGNYGVRILQMASGQQIASSPSAQGVRGALRGS